MVTRADFSYFHGTVVKTSVREKIDSRVRGGGGFIYNGNGFIAPPSVSISSVAVQEFWLQSPQGERRFQIHGELPMRESHKITALWLKNRLVAYVNHATGQFLLYKHDLNAFIGKRPKPTFLYFLIPAVIIAILLGAVIGQMNPSIGHPIRQAFWHNSFLILSVALLTLPFIGLCVGFIRNRSYAKRHASITSLVDAELHLLTSKDPRG